MSLVGAAGGLGIAGAPSAAPAKAFLVAAPVPVLGRLPWQTCALETGAVAWGAARSCQAPGSGPGTVTGSQYAGHYRRRVDPGDPERGVEAHSQGP